jgi:HupE / UreJ protein
MIHSSFLFPSKWRWLLLSIAAVLLAFSFASEVLAHGISEADKQRMLTGGYLQYVTLGATHMLTGYDHLLFLFGVVFFLANMRDVVKFVTVFTIGHCITLIFATFFQITWNYYLIDAVIALSVMYKAFDNNGGFQKVLQVQPPNLLWMVFGFGLLHGFGLSTRLQQLPLGDETLPILGRILSFNLGVELGQIAALAVMVALLSLWRKRASFAKWSYAANLLLLWIGGGLLVMQLHGYWHDSHPDGFRFPVKEHQHAHEDMEINKTGEDSRNTLK